MTSNQRLLREKMGMACALAAYFSQAMKAWGEPLDVRIVMNNTFIIRDEREPKKQYRVVVEDLNDGE